jgi:hypothetical protein
MEMNNQILRKYFIISVLLLLLNDFFLKYYFHNFLTDKLSDFAGLFAFPFFISIFLNKRVKEVYISLALFFIFWKSEYSQGLITIFHQLNFNIDRVVDYTDLIALMILPFSYRYRLLQQKEESNYKFIFPKIAVCFIACFSFMATSKSRLETQINLKSNLEFKTKSTLVDVCEKLDLEHDFENVYSCTLKIEDRNTEIFTTVILEKNQNGIINIKLDSILTSETQGDFIFDSKKEDAQYIQELKTKDFEIIFLQEKILKLYSK